jgi:lysozyme
MHLSKRGAGAILGHEAIYLYAYRDPVNIWTIGGGHTAAAGGIAPRSGMIISFSEAIRIFKQDMRKFEGRVSRAIKVEIIRLQHRFDALVSWDFNTGAAFKGTVDDKLNCGDIDAAMATLRLYVNAGGRWLAGLDKRRREEEVMFRHGRYPTRRILVRDRVGAQGRYIDPASIPWDEPAALPMPVDLDRPVPPLPTRRTPPRRPNFIIDLYDFAIRTWRTL